jgi:type II secretory pathway predicted ATPase ExeA
VNTYEKHFGLLASPFSVTPDPHFCYVNRRYREAFTILRYGIKARKGFVVITGEPGTGKTTLLRILIRSAETSIRPVYIPNPRLNFSELLRFILKGLEIPSATEDRFSMMRQLNGYLVEQLKGDHIVALLVDEAQELSHENIEQLKLLSNLETDNEKLIQIVLMGQPGLERKLNQPEFFQLKQRIALRSRLVPLPSSEVGLYIDFRLKTAGYGGGGLLDRRAVDRIAFYSDGIPRRINVICDNALLHAYEASKNRVTAEIIEDVVREQQPAKIKKVWR